MAGHFWKYVYGNVVLLFVPCLLVVSWINIYIGNLQYDLPHYAKTFLVPSCMLAFVLSFITYPFFAKWVHFTFNKIAFTVCGLVTIFLLIRYGVEFFGLNPFFVTLEIMNTNTKEFIVANQYYSFSLPFTLTSTFILYQLAGLLVGKNKK